jgi:F0F1-type ATP synthase epsilon subunit
MIKIFNGRNGVIGINPLHVMTVCKINNEVLITLTNGDQHILIDEFNFIIESLIV